MDPVTDIFTAMRIESVVYRRLVNRAVGTPDRATRTSMFRHGRPRQLLAHRRRRIETAPAHRRRLFLFLYPRPRAYSARSSANARARYPGSHPR